MDDEIKDTAAPQQAEGLGDSQDASLGEASLDELLNEIPSHDDFEEPAPAKPKESTTTAITSDDVQRMIREATDKSDERIRELEQTNTYLRGRLDEEGRNAPPQRVDESPKDFTFDEAEFSETLQSNAPKAISKLLRDMLRHELGQVTKDVGKQVDEKVNLSAAQQKRQNEYNNDIAGVQREFATELTDQSFKDDCDKELESIIRSRGGDSLRHYQPGDFTNAANRVALRRAREGKLKLNGAEGVTPSTTRPTLQEVRQRAPQSDSMGERRVTRTGPATTIAELFPDNEKDQRIARKIAKDMGIPENRWVASYLRAQSADPDFDRR